MSEEKSYTIGELAQAADVTIRTIRYYVAEDVLPPPLGNSRAALYTEEHLNRLHLIKILKEEFLPLQEIRALLRGLDHQAVLELLAERRQTPAPPLPSANGAKEYLQTLLAPAAAPAETPGLMRHKVEFHQARNLEEDYSQRVSPPAPAKELARASVPAPGDKSNPTVRLPEAQASVWQRLELAPGVELHFKAEAITPPLHAKIEQLVNVARQILTSKQS